MRTESQTLKFKRLSNDDYMRTICTFIKESLGRVAKTITPLETIERQLKAPCEQGKIKFQSTPKTGGYFVREN